MPINIILTGATGTAGSAALRKAIADPEVGRITVITRRPLSVEHEKLRVIIHKDFKNYDDILSELKDHQVALWCLGISQTKVSKEEYYVITYDYTLAAAKAFGAANPDSFTFLYLSGHGADTTEKSSTTFARVKGKVENALGKLGHPNIVCFRPAYIQPEVRLKPTFGGRAIDFVAPVCYKVLPCYIINAADLGKGLLEVAKHGSLKPVLSNMEIQKLANRYSER